jgi:stage II sporulation protein D
MKKILLIVVTLIFIPYLVVNFFVKEKEIEFDLITGNVHVRVKREKTNTIDVIPLEEYIVGVVAGEMPVNFHIEALKAQSVAARSYVLKRIIANRDNEYDVGDTVNHQVYLDNNHLMERWQDEYIAKINKLRKAVFDTKGQVMMYDDKIADALYFSTSNGFTEDSEAVFGASIPYLRQVESYWDEEVSPVFNDQKVFAVDDFYYKLEIPYKDNLSIEILKTTESGRISEIKINNKLFTGREIREKLGIRSTDFTILKENEKIYVKTKGFGHGVGMSQYGANGMALNGYNYIEILEHYYNGVLIKKI